MLCVLGKVDVLEEYDEEIRSRSLALRTPAVVRMKRGGGGHKHAVVASSVQGWVLPHLITWVESRNVDASPIRGLFGRTALEDPGVRVPEATTEMAWRLAASLTRDEALGIHLAESLSRGALDTLDAMAAGLAVSRRTLTRRLAEEGTSFRDILDEVRSDFARALLQDRSLSIGDIAFFLQYSEPAAFHRSFRRWTGLTPQAFREA